MARLGRPPIPADRRRDTRVNLRLTAKEYDTVWKTARQYGLSIPAYVRQQLQNTLANVPPRR